MDIGERGGAFYYWELKGGVGSFLLLILGEGMATPMPALGGKGGGEGVLSRKESLPLPFSRKKGGGGTLPPIPTEKSFFEERRRHLSSRRKGKGT